MARARTYLRGSTGWARHDERSDLDATHESTNFRGQHGPPFDRWDRHGARRGRAGLVEADSRRELKLYQWDLVAAGIASGGIQSSVLRVGRIEGRACHRDGWRVQLL